MSKAELNDPLISQVVTYDPVDDVPKFVRGQRRSVVSVNNEPSLTQQHHEAEANIHNIMAKWQKSGHIPVVNAQPLEGDIVAPDNFQDAMNVLVEAEQRFMSMPVAIREKFHHSPHEFYEFVKDENNRPELVKLGLAVAPQEPTAPVEPPITAPPKTGEGGSTT